MTALVQRSVWSPQDKLILAGIALEDLIASPARSGPKGGERFVLNPATRALELAPARRNEVSKALMRELRDMKLCL